ncbi:hypothetical protein [Agrobacterium rosae]|uniref:hypothetical protein n=1 Tax=Agrobacterium rosae TaxID=1972867 RepID=UPI0020349EC0|nr:hypothetical protein [Agrobacterium rosae]MCM2436324.1 hypothetical protein [Agrobacterium rosae]
MTEKTVVQAWTQQARNHQQTDRAGFWGIGDLLRGSNVLFDACQTMGVRYLLNIDGHPVSRIFQPTDTAVSINDREVEFWTFDTIEEVPVRIATALESDGYLVMNTNGGPVWPSHQSSEWKSWIRQILRPNHSFQMHLKTVLPPIPYNVFHFRLGDSGLVRGERAQLREALEALDRHGEPEDVVITDSSELQEYLRRNRHEIRVSDAKPVHTGLSADIETISQTMSDFFLIGGARKAKSYSVYQGPSGFVVSAARIFDVPVTYVGNEIRRPKKNFIKRALNLWR